MKNTLNNIKLTEDQAETLVDLLDDQLKSQRHELRKGAGAVAYYIRVITHIRNLKKMLKAQLWVLSHEEEPEAEESNLYDFLTIGVKEAERRKAIV